MTRVEAMPDSGRLELLDVAFGQLEYQPALASKAKRFCTSSDGLTIRTRCGTPAALSHVQQSG